MKSDADEERRGPTEISHRFMIEQIGGSWHLSGNWAGGEKKRGVEMIEIKYEPENLRFAAYDGIVSAGECCYEVLDDGVWNAYHTYVKDCYSGQGIAKKLFDALVEQAKEEKVKVMPSCSYIQHCFDKAPDLENMVCPCKEDEE